MRKKSLKTTKMANSKDGKEKVKTRPLTQPSEELCFICDDVVADKGVSLLMTYTSFSKTDLPTKIGQLMGDRFMVIVTVNDVLCKRCFSLINQLDKFEYNSVKVKATLTAFLKIKYQLSDDLENGSASGDDLGIVSTIPEGHHISSDGHSRKSHQSSISYTCKSSEKYCDLKYDFIASQSIKKEKLKAEDCGSITDIKMVNQIDTNHNEDRINVECDVYGEGDDNYEIIDADDSLMHEEFIDDSISAVTIFECKSCSFSTPILDNLIDHLKSHSKHNLYKCSECYQKFETEQDVEHHVKSIHGASEICYNEDVSDLENDPDYYPTNKKFYECSICKYHHHNKKTFDAHVRSHLKSEKFVCNICSKVFKHRITLRKHMLSHKTFKCGLCSALFQNEVSLVHHFKVSHDTQMNEKNVNESPSIVSIVDMAKLTEKDDVIFKKIDGHYKKKVEIKEDIVKCSESSTFYRQVENLLEKIHADHPKEIVSSVDITGAVVDVDNVDEGQICEESSRINKDVTYDSRITISLPSSSVVNARETEDLHIKQCIENPITDSVTSEEYTDRTENDENVQSSNCEILSVLGNDCSSLEESECASSISNTQLVLNVSNEDQMESAEFLESKTLSKDEYYEPENDTSKLASKKIYVCSLCGLKTSSESHIKRHFKCHIALERKTYKCHICERVLTTRSNLKRHISLHENCSSGEIECNMCNEMLTDRLHLKHHMEVQHPESYQCSFCDRRFDSKKGCREHELTHPSLQCDVCHKMFLTEGRLKSHKMFVHSEPGHLVSKSNVFKCHICLKIFTTYHNLKRHLRNHEKYSGAVTCLICNEELNDKLHLRQHVEEKHPENHQCSFCHKVFGNRKSCKTHEMTHPERFVYKCESCDKLFLTEARLKRHKDIMHRDPHCRICGKEISNPLKLLDHERRHERHKTKFPCVQCPKEFRTPSGLKYHMSVHTGKYRVYCEICGKGLHSEVVLAEHKATHTKEVRYTCEKCGRTFSSNSTYRMHRLWHDNPLPYKCNICDRKFKHTSILAVHKRRAHTGERPYKCPHCNLTFSVSSTLNKHVILHTKDYPYRCKLCEKGFTTRTKIARHMAKVHNDFEMMNAKKKMCEYKMVLHPSELSGAQKDNTDESFMTVDHILDEKVVVGEEDEETHAAALEVLEQVTVDPEQAAIFTIFQQDLPSSEFALNEFDNETK